MYVFIYIYIYICTHIYIYIYIYVFKKLRFRVEGLPHVAFVDAEGHVATAPLMN